MRIALLLLVLGCTPDAVAIALCGTDASPGIDPSHPWPRHTILHGGTALQGADGVDMADANGDGLLDLTSGWEQSARTTVHFHPGCAEARSVWPHVVLPGAVSGVEDAVFGDVDGDGRPDVVSAGSSGFRLYVHFQDPGGWTQITIAAATNVQRWLKSAVLAPGDIVAGGYSTGATIDRLTSSTPRVAASWTRTTLGQVGALYSLEPRDVDNDGDTDLVLSDRDTITTPVVRNDLRGSRWLENRPDGWVNHTISGGGGARFLWVDPAARLVIDGTGAEASTLTIRSSPDGLTWGAQPIAYPANTGWYNAAARGDLDGDGLADVVLVHSHAFGGLSGVVWLRAPNWERGEVSGPEGVKFDNVELHDVDCDGDLDIITNEQGIAGSTTAAEKLGTIWYENRSRQ